MNDKIKIYISASIRNAHNNEYITSFFSTDKFKIYLPQTITPNCLGDENFPITVYNKCIEMMEDSDIGLVILDSFGLDSCWECGWYTKSPKFLIGLVEASSNFLRDWMLKGGLDALITTNPRIYNVCLNDPILKYKEVKLINYLSELPSSIELIFNKYKER